MGEAIRARAFEPFFTTKDQGSGTGMGLAMVYGIVRQSGGEIYLLSEIGRGTTVEIYLPRVDEPAVVDSPSQLAVGVPRGSETVLLAEDEESVRTLARRALEGLGYTVIVAVDGIEAAALAERHGRPIDLLVTDVVMPHMGGPQLAGRLRATRPNLTVLYVSGFMGSAAADLTAPGTSVLTKPFTREQLGRAVRRAIEMAG
jgi:CheY-like chemotaxis protein